MWFKVGMDDRVSQLFVLPRKWALCHRDEFYLPIASDALNLILTKRYVCDSFDVECGWCNAAQSAIMD